MHYVCTKNGTFSNDIASGMYVFYKGRPYVDWWLDIYHKDLNDTFLTSCIYSTIHRVFLHGSTEKKLGDGRLAQCFPPPLYTRYCAGDRRAQHRIYTYI